MNVSIEAIWVTLLFLVNVLTIAGLIWSISGYGFSLPTSKRGKR